MFLPAGAAHSVWWFCDAQGRFANWYVNLEEPGVRWDDGPVAGVDMVDQDLDIVVRAGPQLAVEGRGRVRRAARLPEDYWVTDEEAVRAEGERVIELVEAGEFPFDGTWCDFRPPPDWAVPDELPPGWDRPPVR